MKDNKKWSKIATCIISMLLWGLGWAVIVGYAVGGFESVWRIIRPSIAFLLLAFVAWGAYHLIKTRRWINRLNNAWEEFMIKRDVEEYFSKLDDLEKTYEGQILGKMPAKEYFACLRISALKSAGRKEEAYALLESTLKEATSDRTILLLNSEKEHWD